MEAQMITAIGTAVAILLIMLPVLVIFDKLKTDSLTARIRDKIIKEIDDKQTKDSGALREMIEDVISLHVLRLGNEIKTLVHDKLNDAIEKFEMLDRNTAGIEQRLKQAEKDIDNIANECRVCRNERRAT